MFRWSDIRRLKSVARCIVPIELVHVRLQTTTSDLVKLCFAWRQKPVKSVTSSTHFLIKKSYWWETYTNILFCKDFLDNILAKNMSRWWTATKQLPILDFWNLENKIYFWWSIYYSFKVVMCCYPTRIDPLITFGDSVLFLVLYHNDQKQKKLLPTQ